MLPADFVRKNVRRLFPEVEDSGLSHNWTSMPSYLERQLVVGKLEVVLLVFALKLCGDF